MVVTFVHGFTTYCSRTLAGHLRNRLLHVAIPCCSSSASKKESRVPATAQWERLRSGEKKVALFALGSAVIGGFLLKYVSSEASSGKMGDFNELPILVIAGPSGAGKSTLLKKLLDKYPEKFTFSISHTTRQPRQGETHGKEYYFISRDKMKKEIDRGNFIEWAEFSGNMYGTSIESVKQCQKEGKVCVLDIDMQGVKSIKKTELSAVYVHIKPPSLDILEQRLRQRKTDSDEAISKRLATAKGELAEAAVPGMFDHIILNDDLEDAFKAFDGILVKMFGFKDS